MFKQLSAIDLAWQGCTSTSKVHIVDSNLPCTLAESDKLDTSGYLPWQHMHLATSSSILCALNNSMLLILGSDAAYQQARQLCAAIVDIIVEDCMTKKEKKAKKTYLTAKVREAFGQDQASLTSSSPDRAEEDDQEKKAKKTYLTAKVREAFGQDQASLTSSSPDRAEEDDPIDPDVVPQPDLPDVVPQPDLSIPGVALGAAAKRFSPFRRTKNRLSNLEAASYKSEEDLTFAPTQSEPDRADISSDEGDVSLYQPSHGDLESQSVSDIDADLTKMATDVSGIVNYVEGGTNEQ